MNWNDPVVKNRVERMGKPGRLVLGMTRATLGAAVVLKNPKVVREVDPMEAGYPDPAEALYRIPCGRSQLCVRWVLFRLVADGAARVRKASVTGAH